MRNRTISEIVLNKHFKASMAELREAWTKKDRDTVLLRCNDIMLLMDSPEEYLHTQVDLEREYPTLDSKDLTKLIAAYTEVRELTYE